MSDEANRFGQVSSTPEGGPADAGVPAQEPGAGQVLSTPEAAPLAEGEELVPPTWREHMDGPILGMDDAPPAQPAAAREETRATANGESIPAAPASSREESSRTGKEPTPSRAADDELRKWPPYSGKPVSEVRWDALRYAAPIVSQAAKLAIKTIDLSGRGLSKLARFLETRRQERDAE